MYTNKQQIRKERLNAFKCFLIALIPAFIIVLAALGIRIAGNRFINSWNSELRTWQDEANDLSVESVQNIAKLQMIQSEQDSYVGVLDETRKEEDDDLVLSILNDCFSFSDFDEMTSNMSASGSYIKSSDSFFDSVIFSNLKTTSDEAVAKQSIYTFESYVSSFTGSGIYTYYALLTGHRTVSGVNSGSAELNFDEDFTWMLVYTVDTDGTFSIQSGYEIE